MFKIGFLVASEDECWVKLTTWIDWVWWKHQSSGAKRHLLVQTLVCLVWLLARVIQCIIYIAEAKTGILRSRSLLSWSSSTWLCFAATDDGGPIPSSNLAARDPPMSPRSASSSPQNHNKLNLKWWLGILSASSVTSTRYPTRPGLYFSYPNRNRKFFRISGFRVAAI